MNLKQQFFLFSLCICCIFIEQSLEASQKTDVIANFDIGLSFSFPKEALAKAAVSIKDTEPLIRDALLGPEQADKIVVFNLELVKEAFMKIPKKNLVLVWMEPFEVNPSYFELFDKIYTWNDDLVDNIRFFKIYYPSLMPMQQDLIPFQDKKFCVMVAGADLDPKGRVNDLYAERIRMVEFFETKPQGELDIYGKNWKTRVYRDFKGEIPGWHSGQEKIDVLKKYRFSICFENTKGINGYITEKIFCCFAAGCIPVYWGASNIEKYIPKECFIDYRDFATKEDLYLFLKNMKADEYENYLTHIRKFLESDKAKVFSPEYFHSQFYDMIGWKREPEMIPNIEGKS